MSTKILVIDDDENICEVIRVYLENEGYAVLAVICADNAVSLVLKVYPYNLAYVFIIVNNKNLG